MGKHTAIIYVHGIGRHEARENAGKFMERLKLAEARADEDVDGVLRNFRAEITQLGPACPGELLDYVEFSHLTGRKYARWPNDESYIFKRRYRMFEVAWSPLTKNGVEPLKVLFWLLSLALVPISYRRASLRQKPLIRLARLHQARLNSAQSFKTFYWAQLLAKYQKFRGSPGRLFETRSNERRTGTKESFEAFIKKDAPQEATAIGIAAAFAVWQSARLPCERSVATISRTTISFVLALLGLAGCAWLRRDAFAGQEQIWGATTLALGIMLAIVIAGVFLYSARFFFGKVLSDVRIWSGWRENDRHSGTRTAILNRCRNVIESVARHPDCDRIVIVSHSLGTAIAYDALRDIGRRNSASAEKENGLIPLFKLDTFITLGSPIDKLAYLLEARDASSYRAADWHEQLRGNLSHEPFHDGRKPRVAWNNYWDRADPVSDPLFTPLGQKLNGGAFVTAGISNYEVENTRWHAPHSHMAYLDNNLVMTRIFKSIFGTDQQEATAVVTQTLEDSRHRRASQVLNRLLIRGTMVAIGFGLISSMHWLLLCVAAVGAAVAGLGALGLILTTANLLPRPFNTLLGASKALSSTVR